MCYNKLRTWAMILEDVLDDYPTSSVSNALSQIKARIKEIENIDELLNREYLIHIRQKGMKSAMATEV